MFRYVYRQLTQEPLRTGLTVTAIAAVIAVILLLEGFNEGLIAQLRYAVLDRDAELIVTQAGISNMTATRSILPQYARGEVEAVPGVAVAHPLTGIPMIYSQGDRRTPISVIVYDTHGGPSRILAGTRASAAREIVIDRSLAEQHDIKVGDPFVVSDFEFRIAGISAGAAAFFTPFGFVRFDDLIDFYFESDIAADITAFPMLSFLLVELEPGVSRDELASRIEQAVPVVDVFTPEQLAERDADLGRALMGPIFRFMIDVAYLVGLLVIGVIMYAAVNARRRSLGVLKAVGFANGYLARATVSESLVLTLLALPLGMLLAVMVATAFEAVMPLYLLPVLEPIPAARTAAASLVVATLGALVPVRAIWRLEPAIVFGS